MKLVFFLSLVLCSFGLFAQKDPVIATVNGEKMHKSEFLKVYRQNRLFASNRVVTRQQVLEDMISKMIGVQRAKRNKLHLDPAVIEKTDDILYHAQISKDLENQLKKIKVSDADVKKYYKENKEYRTAQILLRLKVDATPKEINGALKVAQDIFRKAEGSPDEFDKLANQYSQAGNAKTGGDMGFQAPNRYAPEYFAAIKGKKVGQVVGPVRTQYGFHIIKVLGVKKFKDINLGVYKKIVYDQKRNAILDRYFEGLRKGAKITLNEKALKSIK